MTQSRRNFLKKSLLSSALFLPSAVHQSVRDFSRSGGGQKGSQPAIISTWNHGSAANAKAWEVLHRSGSILDAVEEGVKVTEADISSRSVGLNGHPDREGIVTLD